MASEPRPYETGDLEGLPKQKLVQLVLAQLECWPLNEDGKKLTATQIKRDTPVAILRRELLDQSRGFRTLEPRNTTTVSTTQPLHLPPPLEPAQSATSGGEATHKLPRAPSLTPGHPVLLCVFVRDLRPQFRNDKGQAGMIVVTCALNPLDRKPFLVSGADVLREIQKTNAAIQGTETVTVSQQFPDNDNYQVTFARDFNPETPDYKTLASTLLRLPGDSNLFLEVNALNATDQQSTPELEDEAKAETKGGSRTAKKDVVAWLQQQLMQRPGYEHFKKNFNRARTNPEIKRRRITQTELANALGYGLTTLKTAVAGYQIVKEHGRLGNQPIESIIEESERTDSPQKGATALYKFLRSSLKLS
ncbi:hypothetical protein PQX77_014534 [Marasmius sp. AFHP31]|nr:hypothetical protein PQX77_014534 [Marasmius sp. AFHP31]